MSWLIDLFSDRNLWACFYLGCGFIALYIVSEVLYRRMNVPVEWTRKLVHLATGGIVLLFPRVLDNHWWVLTLSLMFMVALVVGKWLHLIPSIDDIGRKSGGSLIYPIVLYGCFLVFEYTGHTLYFDLPILIMAVSDTAAALIGQRWPKGKYTIMGNTKTLMGSGAFLITAAALVCIRLVLAGDWPVEHSIGLALVIGLFTTLAEAVSGRGFDNLTVPATTLVLLGAANAWMPFVH